MLTLRTTAATAIILGTADEVNQMKYDGHRKRQRELLTGIMEVLNVLGCARGAARLWHVGWRPTD
jgi:hypothetical protein